jgi:peroxiredoxin
MTDSAVRDYTQAGPQVGERFPDVRLPDQSGEMVNLHEARRGKRAIIVFHRSARW